MPYDLGIDVGTSYTAAALRADDGAVEVFGLGPIADSIPTVLYLNDDGTMVVGDAANRKALIDGSGAAREFKRRLGDPTPLFLRGSPFSAEALMARMFRHVIERVVDREGEHPQRIAVCHPANWGLFKMDIFGQALQMAGLDDVILISEPAAAAVAYAAETRMASGATIAVYDLGGGTFDAAVLRKTDSGFDIIGEPVGLEHVGGMDFDSAVLDFIQTTSGIEWQLDPDDAEHVTAMSHLRRSCVEAKELLSSESEAQIAVMLPGVEDSVRLQRAVFESRIRPILETTLDALERAIERASLTPADLSAILLVGGSSRIPLVAQLLSERFGELVRVDIDPVHAAAKGAAIAARALADPALGADRPSMPTRPGRPLPGSAAAPSPPVTPPQLPDDGHDAAPAVAADPSTGARPHSLPPPPWLTDPPATPTPATPTAATPTPATPTAATPTAATPTAATPSPATPTEVTPTPLAPTPATPMSEAPSAAAETAPPEVFEPSDPAVDHGVGFPRPPSGQPPAGGGTGGPSEPRERRRLALVGVPVVLLLVLGAVAYAMTRGDDKPLDASAGPGSDQVVEGAAGPDGSEDTAVDAGTPEPAVLGMAMAAPADGMIEIPAGTYPLGLDGPEANSSESLTQTVDLPAFFIDAFEVTNAGYKDFVDKTGAETPASWRGGTYPEDRADHPVEGVSHEWATAFCTASSKRLPTESEWEVAARGSEGRIWPWGDDRTAVELPDSGTYPVGSVPGNVSPFGVFDLAGNVWEWVADSYDQRVGPDLRVLRGGQNGFLRENVTRLPVDPIRSSALRTAGFRCAADGLDPNAATGTFVDYVKPERPNEPEVVPLPAGVEVFDDFSDSTSGWTELTVDGQFRRGYHPNEFLHLETQAPMKEALALGPWRSNPDQGYALLTSAFVEPSLTTPDGTFSYGLAFGFDDDGRGLVFMVDERSSTWQLASREPTGAGPFGADGAEYVIIEEASRSIPAEVELEVVDLGEGNYQFKIGGSAVHTRNIPGFDGTANGLVLISRADSQKVHIHFEEFQVNDLG